MPAVFFRGICSNLTGSVTLSMATQHRPLSFGLQYLLGHGQPDVQQHDQVGKITNLTIPNLIGGKTYYFMVKSYDLLGVTNLVSSEISAVPKQRASR